MDVPFGLDSVSVDKQVTSPVVVTGDFVLLISLKKVLNR